MIILCLGRVSTISSISGNTASRPPSKKLLPPAFDHVGIRQDLDHRLRVEPGHFLLVSGAAAHQRPSHAIETFVSHQSLLLIHGYRPYCCPVLPTRGVGAPFGVSQSFTVPSMPAVATIVPSWEKVTKCMRRRCPLSAAVCLRVATFQRRTVLSRPTDASVFPSGEKAQKRTHAVWPLNGSNSLRVLASKSCTSLAAPADASIVPSGENATEWTGPVCTSMVAP